MSEQLFFDGLDYLTRVFRYPWVSDDTKICMKSANMNPADDGER